MDKRIPMRTCIGCREVRPKKELLRIVRTAGEQTGEIRPVPDPSGLMDGRGAYICRSTECLKKAVRRKGFERAFRMSVSADELSEIEREIAEASGQEKQ